MNRDRGGVASNRDKVIDGGVIVRFSRLGHEVHDQHDPRGRMDQSVGKFLDEKDGNDAGVETPWSDDHEVRRGDGLQSLGQGSDTLWVQANSPDRTANQCDP